MSYIISIFTLLFLVSNSACDIQIPRRGTITTGTLNDTVYDGHHQSETDSTSYTDTHHSTGTDTSTSPTDATNSQQDSLNYDSRDAFAEIDTRSFFCSDDSDCGNIDDSIGVCIGGYCDFRKPCLIDAHCNDLNVCNGKEYCNKKHGYCEYGDSTMECPYNSPCKPSTGCQLSEPIRSSECSTDEGCFPDEQCNTLLGGVCTVADGASCSRDTDCDDLSACTTGRCKSGKCENLAIICDDWNPYTNDSCHEFSGCVGSWYFKLEVKLRPPHNHDLVRVRLPEQTLVGIAPYQNDQLDVEPSCRSGIYLDFNTSADAAEDGWYGCPGNPSFPPVIESISVDNNDVTFLYDIRQDPQAPCGKSVYLSRTDLGCSSGWLNP